MNLLRLTRMTAHDRHNMIYGELRSSKINHLRSLASTYGIMDVSRLSKNDLVEILIDGMEDIVEQMLLENE